MNSWIDCPICDEEYRIVTGVQSSHAQATFCPFCGGEVGDGEDDDIVEIETDDEE